MVVKHLYSMKGQSMRKVNGAQSCAYRGRAGAKCAIGCMIPDDVYEPQMEGRNIASLLGKIGGPDRPIEALVVLFEGINVQFILDLQVLHDTDQNWDENGFRRKSPEVIEHLRWIAMQYGVTYKE